MSCSDALIGQTFPITESLNDSAVVASPSNSRMTKAKSTAGDAI
jgi:hypothetical protein